jgi:hypothetical protein
MSRAGPVGSPTNPTLRFAEGFSGPSAFDVRSVCTVRAAVSQWERVGNITFGYRLSPDDRHLEPDAAEQAALSAIRDLGAAGHSLRCIAATLDSHGHRTRPGLQVAPGLPNNHRLSAAGQKISER